MVLPWIKPVILVVGGSSGSKFINDAVRGLLDDLLANYQIIHLCGKGNIDKLYNNRSGYVQFEYAGKELRDMFALSSLVISVPVQMQSVNCLLFTSQIF